MNNGPNIFRAAVAAGVVVSCLMVAGSLSVSILKLSAFYTDPDQLAGVSETFTDFLADSLTESGLRPAGLDSSDPLLLERTIVISEGMNEGVARRVVETLLHLDAVDPEAAIDLYVSTVGGWSDSAFTIVDGIEAIRAPVNTIAIGGCYSAGTIVLVAGTGTRSAGSNVVISVHANLANSEGEFSRSTQQEERLEAHYRKRASLPEDWFPLSGDEEHYYLSPKQALEFGIVDAVVHP